VHAQIPASVPFASKEIAGVTELKKLQLMNLAIINDPYTSVSKKGRVNSWTGVNIYSTIGNYTSNYDRVPDGNEIWTMSLYSDGRFRISPDGRNDLCITFNTEASNFSTKEFGRDGKRVFLSACSNVSTNQQFFLQESASTKATPAGLSYVIRSTNVPDLCLATMNNQKKSASLSPLTMQDCQPNSNGSDRWRITTYSDVTNVNTADTLHLMATLFALHNYSRTAEDGTREMIYNKDISAALVGDFSFAHLPYYRKIPFMSPFDGRLLDIFYNSTPTVQELHIERFKTEGFDKSIEIGSKITVPIFGWSIDTKGKLDFKSSTQLNTKLWLNVDPYTSMWFTSSLSKVSGTYNINITTDLNDSWLINGSKFSQELMKALVVCSSASTDPICIQSAYSSD
jgi:hypothetical protein